MMKRLILLWLLLCAAGVRAQNGGTAFVVPSTGLSGAQSAVVGALTTNVDCYVTANGATNRVIISTSPVGTGTYVLNTSSGVWTNTDNIHVIFYDGSTFFVMSNTVTLDDLYDTSSNPPFSTWDDDLGGGGALPTGAFDDATNCFTNVVATGGASLGLGVVATNVWFVTPSGNNTNNIKGRIDRPGRTFQHVATEMADGDVMYLWDGDYPFDAAGDIVYLTNNIRIVGQSREGVKLGNQGGPEERIRAGNSNLFESLTFFGAIQFGFSPPSVLRCSTNSVVRNCTIIGDSDAIEADCWDGLRIENSYLFSKFDGFADWDVRPGGSNRVVKFFNCDIVVSNGSSLRCLEGGDNRIEMYGGSLTAWNGTNTTHCVRMDFAATRTNKTGSVFLSNVRLIARAFGANTAYTISNFSRIPIFLENCSEERVIGTLAGAGIGSYTNAWSDRFVTVTNVGGGTNVLVDTRSLTNALVSASEQGHRVVICDGGFNAGTSNIWIVTQGNQKILATGPNTGPTQTNLSANGGCLALRIVGTNWMPEAAWP